MTETVKRETVEELADLLAHTVVEGIGEAITKCGPYGAVLVPSEAPAAKEKLAGLFREQLGVFLRSHNIDPATMQPMDNSEKGCPVEKYESAWLIEIPGKSPLWYAGLGKFGSCLGKHGWTYDACKAKRFYSKQEAQQVIDTQRFDNAIATEHGFDSTTVEELQAKAPPPRDVDREMITEVVKLSKRWCKKRMDDASRFPEVLEDELPGILSRHLKPERDEHERVKAELSNEKNTVQHKHEAWQDEKRRRVYYQDIVYDVCNHLDRIFGGKCCCGTIEEPSEQVQSLMKSLGTYTLQDAHKKASELEQQLAESRERVKELECIMGNVMRRAASMADDLECCLTSEPQPTPSAGGTA